MNTIYIETDDENLTTELLDLDIPGVEVTARLTAAVSFDQVTELTISAISSPITQALLLNALYDVLKTAFKRVVQGYRKKTSAEIEGHRLEDIQSILFEIEQLQKEVGIQNDKTSKGNPSH